MSEFESYDMTKFLENCEKMNLILSTEQQQQFVRYYELLVEWNSFMNLTGGSIVNIPLVGIREEHQGKGLSTIMLKHSMDEIFKEIDIYNSPITEINTTTETNNLQALRLYKNLGFLEDYSYPQSYMPIEN